MINRESIPSLGSENNSFSDIIDAIPVAIYITDAMGYLTHYNEAAVEFSGRTPELGSDQWCVTWKLYHTDGTPMPHDTCPMAVALREKRKVTGKEAIAERPDSKRIWFEAHPSPLLDDKGNLTGGVNMLIDITERKKAEKQIRLNEKELTDFFENATLGLHWVGPDGIVQRVNQSELDMLGYRRDEYVGRHIADFHADKDVIDDILRRLKAGEELHDYEARMQCKDGSIRHVVINTNVYREDGKFIHTRCFTRDITEQKKAELALARDIAKRKKVEKALRASEEKYRTLFRTIDEGFSIIELFFDDNEKPVDYRFLEVNPAFEKHTGLKHAEGKKISALAPDIEQYWFETYGKVAVTGKPVRFESFSDALNRWFDVYAFRIGKPNERKVALLFNDITGRKQSEYNNALLGAIINGSDDAIISKNLDSVITSWNPGAERMFGYSAQEAIGKSITMLFPDQRINEEDKILEQIKRGERVDQFETVRVRKNGTSVDVSITISPIKNSSGEIVGVSKIARDITRRKQNRIEKSRLLRDVKTERERLEQIFQHAPSFMCVLRGPDHVFERANDLYFELVGNRELIGKPVHQALPEVEEQGFFKLLDKVYQTGETYTGTDVPIKLQRNTPDGQKTEERYLNFVYQPIRSSDGTINGIFVQGIDLTKRKHAEEKLKAVNETLEEKVKKRTQKLLSYQEQLRILVSQLSKAEENERQRLAAELHDNLGQLLTVGKMKLDQLQISRSSFQADPEIKELSELMNKAIHYTRELMSDLKPPPSLQHESLKKAMQWVADKMKTYNLKVTIEDDGQPKPLSEEVQSTLTQSVRELLFNVIKHAGTDHAWIFLSRRRQQVQIIVEDKGVGFDPREEKLIPGPEGKFGLFNLKERLKLLDGSLEIFSQKGEGTKAILLAPAKNGEVESQTSQTDNKTKDKPAYGPETKIKVLLADDHLMMREGLRKIIEEEKDLIIIAEAASGEEAIELALENSPDVVVMDVNMSGMNGIEATRKIHAGNQRIRIIGLSLYDDKNVATAMKNAGASAYLSKTEATGKLCAIIRNE